jgi:hypothetical protein
MELLQAVASHYGHWPEALGLFMMLVMSLHQPPAREPKG